MFPELLGRIARELDACGIPYMVIGGQALLVHGEPRLTQDIDITLGVAADEVARVLKLTQQLNLQPLVPEPARFVQETMVLPVRDAATHQRVDIIFSRSDYERQAIARSREVKLAGTPVRFAAAEDLIVHKVVAGRPRDIEDVRSVLLKNPELDRDYVRRWLREFDRALAAEYSRVFERLVSGCSGTEEGPSS